MNKASELIRDVLKVQGYDGNWNYDPYMMGLYNGLELALSIVENREPEFKSKPETWGADIAVTHVLAKDDESERTN